MDKTFLAVIINALEDSRNSHTYEAQTAYQSGHNADLDKDKAVMRYRGDSFTRLERQCLHALDKAKALMQHIN